MQDHPLTPMTDPDLRRWLGRQVAGEVGHVAAGTVFAGVGAVRDRMAAEARAGRRLIVADAIRDADLVTLGQAAEGQPLLTGGSGLALGLPGVYRAAGLLADAAVPWRGQDGPAVVLSGSCSTATRGQVALHGRVHSVREVSAEAAMDGTVTAETLVDWALAQDGLPLIATSADPAVVRAAQDRHGREAVATTIEALFAATARALVARGATRLVVAGGETSGAVVEGLSLDRLEIGPEIDPGVPMLRAGPDLVLALKSGNFGAPDFFARAAAAMVP